MRAAVLILGDQLFPSLEGLPCHLPVVMHEDARLARHVRHHQQKVVLFFSAMRHWARAQSESRPVQYVRWGEPGPGLLARLDALDEVWTFEPHDRALADELRSHLGSRLRTVPSPAFLTSDSDWRAYARGRRRKMGDFYIHQRRRLGVLVEGNDPAGGQWSFDADNRERVPRGMRPPPIPWVAPDAMTEEVIQVVEREFADHPGRARDFAWPVTRADARRWLDDFLEARFAKFGPFEDALEPGEDTLWHSLLSPILNLGLLTPGEVVDAALAHRERVPLASLEGFLRQVIGWREFMKRIDLEYAATGADQRNALGHRRRLAPCWWDGSTGVPPLDRAIDRCQRLGWTHHIERLMVLGAGMLMCEVHPREAYRWFMEMFIDSADWVMAPNVFGMSQFSDGGVFATKPYLSGSAYLLRMSHYEKGPWCDVWDGLYWRTIDRHRNLLMKNPRMAQIARGVDRLDPGRRERIFASAEAFIQRVTLPEPELGIG